MKNWIVPIVPICILSQILFPVNALQGATETASINTVLSLDGCTDPLACNYDVNAVTDDGSCYYNTSNCPDDPCNNDADCVESNSLEIDAKMVVSTSSCNSNLYCIKIEVRGQGGADYLGGSSVRFTYDPDVVYFDRYTVNSANQEEQEVGAIGTYSSTNFDNNQTSISPGCNMNSLNATPYSSHSFDGQISGDFLITIFLNTPTGAGPDAPVFACPSVQDTWTEFAEICFDVKDPKGNPNFQFVGAQNGPATGGTQFNSDLNNPDFKYWNGTLSGLNTPFDEICSVLDMMGCTNIIACNYNVNATVEDGSCIYESACDTDPCTNGGTQVWDSASCGCVLQMVTISGCMDANACNYNVSANCNDGSCIYESVCDTDICTNGGVYVWNNASCTCELSQPTVWGCTNTAAPNYDPLANCDDGSCGAEIACDLNIQMPNAGWHLISSYCKPVNDSIEAIFRPIISDIIQVKSLTGQVYIPAFNGFNNGLDFWDVGAGYIVKTAGPSTLNIKGESEVDLSVDNIPLYTGWNLIACWLHGNADPKDVFENINSEVIQVKNLSGAYVPSFNNFNNMGDMSETGGYLVKMNAASTLSYDKVDVSPMPVQDIETNLVHFVKEIKPNPNTSTLLVKNDENNNLNYGDELGVFTKDNLLVGAFVYQDDLMGGLIFGDDETEDGIDGILENENYVFRVWDKELNTERSVEMEFMQGSSTYSRNDLCVVSFKLNSGINEIKGVSVSLSPNPASSQVTFDINLVKSENLTVEIYRIDGQLVDVVFDGKLTTGNSKIDYNVDHLSTGLYIYKISNGDAFISKRLTIID